MRLHAPRNLVFVLILAFALHAPRLAFAADGAYAPAESAAVARTEWAAMRKARAAGEFVTAARHARRAHAAWPGQWVYAYGVASVGAMAGDTAMVRSGLRDLRDLGAAPDLSRDTLLHRMANAVAPELNRDLEAMASTKTRSEVAFRFPEADSAFWPEGLAYDAKRGDFYVTSVREGRIARVDSTGHVHRFAQVAPRGWAALGLAVDPRSDRVWVGAAALPQAVGYSVADSGRGAIFAFDRSSGAEVARFDLPPAPEGHVPGDVLVTPGGDVYVSDSGQPVLWRIGREVHHGPTGQAFRESYGHPEVFATNPGFRSLQGLAFDGGRTFYVADYSHGIAAIDMDTRSVSWLRPIANPSILGIDGLAWIDGGLVAVQNGFPPARMIGLTLEGEGAGRGIGSVRQLARNREAADEPTLLVVAGSRVVYIANSQWEKYGQDGTRQPGTTLRPPLGLAIPVPTRLEAPVEDR